MVCGKWWKGQGKLCAVEDGGGSHIDSPQREGEGMTKAKEALSPVGMTFTYNELKNASGYKFLNALNFVSI